VGSALIDLIGEEAPAIAEHLGLAFVVERVAVRSPSRHPGIAPGRLATDPLSVATDPEIDVVVELMGGSEPAGSCISAALAAGKPVVTANKELIATQGSMLHRLASTSSVPLLYEAAVAGAIPIVRPLRESLAGERVSRVMGIVNGTTNSILTRMSEDAMSFEEALAEAQALGYAEADPSSDIEGKDAAYKAAILATLAFGASVQASDVYREGISGVTASDVAFARQLGYEVKLLAVAERAPDEESVAVRVHPAMVPAGHPLASVRGSYNAIFVEGDAAGPLMFYGQGAGGRPTASAVLGDVIDAALYIVAREAKVGGAYGSSGHHGHVPDVTPAKIYPMGELVTQYYVSIEVADRPGVLAAVASVFGASGVSIRSMEQVGIGDEARLVFLTHAAKERAIQSTLSGLRGLEAVERVGALLRVVGGDLAG